MTKSIDNIIVINADIASANADVIICHVNGCGRISGKQASGFDSGSLRAVRRYCCKKARRYSHVPAFLFGRAAGDIFTSSGFGQNCREIIYAVVSWMPFLRIKEKTIIIFANSIFKYCRSKKYNTIAMPFPAVKHLDKRIIYDALVRTAMLFSELTVYIYDKQGVTRNERST